MIEKLNLGNLKNSDHYRFMEETVNATKLYPYIAQTFPTPVDFLKNALDAENEAYLKSTWFEVSDDVKDANDTRILRFREVNNMLKGAELCTDSEKAKGAAYLLRVMKNYGGASKILALKVVSMTGVLTNLIEDFQKKYPEKVAAVGITECVEELRVANEAYKTLVAQRNEEHSEKIKDEMQKARNVSDENWRGLIDSVNWRYHYEKDAQQVPFMNYMKTLVAQYRHYTGQKPAGSGGSGSGEGGEAEVVYKYATFEFVNGTQQRLLFAVGAPIIAPENTPGYQWKPAIPEKMPNRGKTFKEVAIEAKKFTALFHFADHREEEIKQVAGSVLTAPENTEGYVWDPEVPATMPAEDTTYYEIAAEEEETEQKPGEGEQKPGTGTEQQPGTGTEQQPTLYKITYMHKGQVYAVQEYEVGARITTIDPPQGYYWRETTPGIMPAHDITITSTDDPYGIL